MPACRCILENGPEIVDAGSYDVEGPPISRATKSTDVPERWREIAQRQKAIVGWPDWPDVELPPPPPKGRPVEQFGMLRTQSGKPSSVVFSLETTDGVGIEGARLRITAWPFLKCDDVTATLEILTDRGWINIARLDAWPRNLHRNSREVARRSGVPTEVVGCHVHRFAENASFGPEAFTDNLPVARPLDGVTRSFREFLAIVEREFCVEIGEFPAPPGWDQLPL